MVKWSEVVKSIDSNTDYTVKEVVAMGVKQHCVYGYIKRGIIKSKKVFGRMYINGAVLKEYINKDIDNL